MNAGALASFLDVLGWTLIHFVWQGTAIVAVVALVLRLPAFHDPRARYAALCAGMFTMLVAPIVTYAVFLSGAPSSSVLARTIAGLAWSEPSGAELAPWLGAVWFAGAAFLEARVVVQFLRARRLARCGVAAPPTDLGEWFDRARRDAGVARGVTLHLSAVATVPMVIGWLRPVVLVPIRALTGLTPDQLRSVLLHELAHVRRHDAVVNVVQAVFESLLFFHPAVWWISRRIRVEREFCCDDDAVRVCGDPLSFARALSLLDSFRDGDACVAVASTGGSLMERIERLIHPDVPSSRFRGGIAAPLALAVVLVAGAGAASFATSADPSAPTAPAPAPAPIGVADVTDAEIEIVLKEVAARLTPEQSKLVAELHAMGVDHGEILSTLAQTGGHDVVIESIHVVRQRSERMKRLRDVHLKLKRELEAGRLSKEQVHGHLIELERQRASRPHAAPEGAAARPVKLRQLHQEIKHLELQKVELESRLVEIHQRLAAGAITRDQAHAEIRELLPPETHGDFDALHARIGTAPRAGDVEPEPPKKEEELEVRKRTVIEVR